MIDLNVKYRQNQNQILNAGLLPTLDTYFTSVDLACPLSLVWYKYYLNAFDNVLIS